jgi:hypothetical protein
LKRIQDDGWTSIEAGALTRRVPQTDAAVSVAARSTLSTALACFERVFGDFMENFVLPSINQKMRVKRETNNVKHLKPLNRQDLLNFFVVECIDQLQHHQKHRLKPNKMAEARDGLMGRHRFEAIRSCFAVGNTTLRTIVEAWPAHLMQFLTLGAVYVIDETISQHFGKLAADQAKLRNVVNKPHPYGMLSWVLCQRLRLSGLSIALGFEPDFLAPDKAPSSAVGRLLGQIQAALPAPNGPRLLVADSLWCNSIAVEALEEAGVRYLISLKQNSGFVPPDLLAVAQDDLPAGWTRTYTKGARVVQVRGTASGDTFGLVTNMWEQPDFCAARANHLLRHGPLPLQQRHSRDDRLVAPADRQARRIAAGEVHLQDHWVGRNSRRGRAGRPRTAHARRCCEVAQGDAAALLPGTSEEEAASIDEQGENAGRALPH